MADTGSMTVGFLLFPGITQLDMTGPFEVLSRLKNARILFIGKSKIPVIDRGLQLTPTHDFSLPDALDIFVVPGGPGIDAAMVDEETVTFVRRCTQQAKFVFGICTGSLLLAATGLLAGKRVGGHWQARDLLAQFGAEVSHARMTVDGKFYTAGGVTSGIDMALRLVEKIEGEDAAMCVQLQIEYAPEPPFKAGTPYEAPAYIVNKQLKANHARRVTRELAVKKAFDALVEQGLLVPKT